MKYYYELIGGPLGGQRVLLDDFSPEIHYPIPDKQSVSEIPSPDLSPFAELPQVGRYLRRPGDVRHYLYWENPDLVNVDV